jgi:hypothetical protein
VFSLVAVAAFDSYRKMNSHRAPFDPATGKMLQEITADDLADLAQSLAKQPANERCGGAALRGN